MVALGVDAAAADPESPLEVGAAGFREAGRVLGALGVPTVVVQEGGYELGSLGAPVREALLGLEEGPSVRSRPSTCTTSSSGSSRSVRTRSASA